MKACMNTLLSATDIRATILEIPQLNSINVTINVYLIRFSWRSPKIIYCAISFLGSSMVSVFNILRVFATGINSTKMSKLLRVLFYKSTPSFIQSALLSKILENKKR